MKRIPEQFELTEEDVKEAIAFWLNQEHGDGDGYDDDFDIEFAVTTHHTWPEGAPRGGMSDPVETTVITAKATKTE